VELPVLLPVLLGDVELGLVELGLVVLDPL
jgi:hypothetical protein